MSTTWVRWATVRDPAQKTPRVVQRKWHLAVSTEYLTTVCGAAPGPGSRVQWRSGPPSNNAHRCKRCWRNYREQLKEQPCKTK